MQWNLIPFDKVVVEVEVRLGGLAETLRPPLGSFDGRYFAQHLGPSQKNAGRPFGANSNCFEIGRPSPPMASLFMAEEPVCIAMVEFGFASGVGFA